LRKWKNFSQEQQKVHSVGYRAYTPFSKKERPRPRFRGEWKKCGREETPSDNLWDPVGSGERRDEAQRKAARVGLKGFEMENRADKFVASGDSEITRWGLYRWKKNR